MGKRLIDIRRANKNKMKNAFSEKMVFEAPDKPVYIINQKGEKVKKL